MKSNMTDSPTAAPTAPASSAVASPQAPRKTQAPRPAPRRDAGSLAPGLNPIAVLHALRRRWKSAVFLAVPAAAVAAAAVWFLVPATYTAYAVLGIDASEPKLVFDTAESKPDFSTYRQRQIGHITSHFVLNAALRKPGVGDSATLREQPYPIDWLETNLEVGTHRSPEFLKIALTGTRPAELAAIVNAVKDAYLEEVVHAERNARMAKLANLERIFEETDEKVRLKQSRVDKLARQLGSGDSKALSIRQQMSLEYFAQLQREYSRVRFDLMREQIEPNSSLKSPAEAGWLDVTPGVESSRTPAEASGAGSNDPETTVIVRRITRLRDVIARFEKQVVDKSHPALLEHQRQLQMLEHQLAERMGESGLAEVESPTGSVPRLAPRRLSRRETLQRQEQLLREEVEKYSNLVDTIGTSSFELESMQTELTQITKISDRVYQELAALKIELQSPPRVNLLQSADVPQKKDLGKKGKLTGMVGFGTLGLILAAFTLVDLRQRRVSNPVEISEELTLPVLGTLPPKPLVQGEAAMAEWDASLVEASDSVRTLLLRPTEDGTTRQVFVVSSAASGEGKSTLAAALARSFARAGRRTLVIDFDLRRPTLHKLFGLTHEFGASEALNKEIEAINVVQESGHPGLFVMTAGSCSKYAIEALTKGEAGRVVRELRSEFDCIVLDTPPLLVLADGAVVGKEADAAVLAVRRDDSRIPFVTAARDRLAALGVPVVGAVLVGYRSGLQQSVYDYHRRERTTSKAQV